MLRSCLVLLCILLLMVPSGSGHAQNPASISPSVFLRGLELANGVRYTASFIKPTDDTVMRNVSAEITLPADAILNEMLVSRQVQFHVVRRNQAGQLTLIWQLARVEAQSPLDPFAFMLATPLNSEVEFYLKWQDEQGQTFVENFFELPSTLPATEAEASVFPFSLDFIPVGNSGIQVSAITSNLLNFRILANNFNPPPEYGSIWWCSLVELQGLIDGESAMVMVPLRRPVAPFTELFLFQQQGDGSWLALDEKAIVTADGQFAMYEHSGGLIATGGDEKIQLDVIAIDESGKTPPIQSATITDGTSNTVFIGEFTPTPLPTQSGTITDGTSNTVFIGEFTPTPLPTQSGTITDGTSNTVFIGEFTPTPLPTQSGTITDGTSNTVFIGEFTPTPLPTQSGTITDGTSNTVFIGEFTPTPLPTQSGTITDGTSNTVFIGEFTPTVSGPSPAETLTLTPVPSIESPDVIRTIPAPFGAGGRRILIVETDDGETIQCQVGSVLCVALHRRAGNGRR